MCVCVCVCVHVCVPANLYKKKAATAKNRAIKDPEQGLVTVAGRGAHLNKAPYDMLQLRVSRATCQLLRLHAGSFTGTPAVAHRVTYRGRFETGSLSVSHWKSTQKGPGSLKPVRSTGSTVTGGGVTSYTLYYNAA